MRFQISDFRFQRKDEPRPLPRAPFIRALLRHLKSEISNLKFSLLLSLLLCAPALAQNATPEQPAPEQAAPEIEGPPAPPRTPSLVELIEQQRTLLEARAATDEVARRALELYNQALADIGRAREWQAQASAFERDRLAAPAEAEAVQTELAAPLPSTPEVPPGASIEQLETQRDEAEAALRAAQDKHEELQDEKARREKRRGEIPVERQRLRDELEDVNELLAAPPLPDEAPEIRDARLAAARARQGVLEAHLQALDRELANYDARRDLLPLRQERWLRRRDARDKLARAWRELVVTAQQEVAAAEAAEARRRRDEAAPRLRAIADRIIELADVKTGPQGVVERRAEAEREHQSLLAELASLRERFRIARARALAAATADVSDERLRRQRSELPDVRRHREAVQRRRAEISDVQIALSDREYELETMAPDEVVRAEIMAGLPPNVPPEDRAQIAAELDRLLSDRRVAYRTLIADYQEYLDALLEAQQADQDLIAVTDAFQEFIDERILWIRSTSAIRPDDFVKAGQTLAWIISPVQWAHALRDLGGSLRTNPVPFGFGVIGVLVLLVGRRRLRLRLEELANEVRRLATDTMSRTTGALLITVVLALPGPALLELISWRLRNYADAGEFSRFLAAGLHRAAALYFIMELVRQLCRRNGLADAHFKWRQKTRLVLRRNLLWFEPVVLPLAVIVAGLEWLGDPVHDPLGRFGFIAAMIVLSIFIARVLRPSGGALEGIVSMRRGGWVDRLEYVWYAAATALPAALGIAAGFGYYYTAIQFERRLVDTFWLVLVAVLVYGLVLRWLMLARRRMAIEEARKRRAAALADTREATPPADGGEATAPPPEEIKLDIAAIDTQARHMLQVVVAVVLAAGIWMTWVDLLPALAVLDRFELWPRFGFVSEVEAAAQEMGLEVGALAAEAAGEVAEATDGGAAVTTVVGLPLGGTATEAAAADAVVSGRLTLADIGIAVLIIVLMVLISRDLPGMLEITLLRRLPLEPSGRYATTTLVRYVVLIAGVILAFNAIGVGWSKVQWLVAAISVGLGFGLQEIVANFVSGIIILFERPIRVGDAVTVSETSGTVTRIRMRATTIVDWDRKELIIPNKEFVTGQVINWTLSDPILRVRILVGIAYGSETGKARELLLECAAANERVLKDPKPQALFMGFGDSALNFELRVFIPHIDHFVAVRDELHEAVDQAFRAAKIEIAFPQRDLHIRSIAAPVTVARGGS